MDQPLISVIVPVYKVEKYLDQCICSIVNQTYRNLEIILVDDGSPDRSGAICDIWAEKDSRIRVIHQENGGGGKARNTALDAAKGDLIAFVDSDDYISRDMLEHLENLIVSGYDIAECNYVVTEDDDASFEETGSEPMPYTALEAMSCHIQDTVFRQLIWNKLYRRIVVGDIRFPVGTKIDDEFFTYRVLGNAEKLIRSEKRCYAYRQQPGSVMHQKNPVKIREGIRAKQERLVYLQEYFPELENAAKRELLMACVYALQGYRKDLEKTQRKAASREICSVIEQLDAVDVSEGSAKQKLLMKAAMRWPEAVAAVLNFLIDIHILT